ncbi:diacylglycerol O-acyltransferase 1-like isoform X2 [Girardinichthys multiradiatus]|uniref:diacylglycerol O-acyltransferase 1-like isoform X2 n=1 Tax=Girardinichthys multiradiatus TaxID=208333 RepID=UPI001FAD2A21|nr:diacylglycerol O-acyltransferase 1-like isoform X2 [Girardinichthys multiradiatus]
MAGMRKRFVSSSAEEDDTTPWENLHLSDLDPATEQEHPYASLLHCHRIQDSLLSSNSNFTGYRGVLNWIIILLVLTHAHLFLENFIQHGFLIDVRKILGHLIEDSFNWPSVNLILAANLFVLVGFYLEKSLERGVLSSTHGHCLHMINLGFLLLCPAVVIACEPKISAEKDLDGSVGQTNLTLGDLYYFLFAPTLCYQRDFPFTPKISINKLFHRLLEMVVVIQIMVGIVQQWIEPIFQRSDNPFSGIDITLRVEHLVSLAAPTHFLWLLFFFLSHSCLNFSAELLRFGDRHFYGDWWNAPNLITFWKNWNIPLQKWSHRHLCSQLVDRKVSPSQAELLVFLVSAALFEYLIALPLHICHLWIFLMMVLELLVAVFLGSYFHGNYGNGFVWLCLLLGPPLAVTTYFHDHYIL